MSQKVHEPDIERAIKKWVDPQHNNPLDQVIEDMAAEDLRANSYNVIGANPGEKSKSSSNQKASNENQDSKDSKLGVTSKTPPEEGD